MTDSFNIPLYLGDDFSMLVENIISYDDPESPDALKNYADSILLQLQSAPDFIASMPDQLALALMRIVRVDSAKLCKLDFSEPPPWDVLRGFVGVHGRYRELVSGLMGSSQESLAQAILLLHFYHQSQLPAAPSTQPRQADEDGQGHSDYDENDDQNDDAYYQDHYDHDDE